ncbi:hypothetical protein YE105_C3097 [Yersinia enterocolitica subsp. palearctica 105.5R(r)]|nr:hypothetical protein YE105_C3097 [Yersinia enterocolitica subsp. palearctica 105.5R(r)]
MYLQNSVVRNIIAYAYGCFMRNASDRMAGIPLMALCFQ